MRSRQDLSSGASTPPTSAGSSTGAGSPILLPATPPASAEVPSGGENQTRLAGRSQGALAPGAPAGSPNFNGEAAGGVSTTISGVGGGTVAGTAIARRKPVPSLVPPPVLVTAVGGELEKEWDADGNIYSSALPLPLPPTPSPTVNRTYLSPSDAEGAKRWSGSYSDDTLAVMEEQRRKRAMLHGRHQHNDDDPAEDDGTPEPDLEEKEDGEVVSGANARLRGGGGIIPFPVKIDSPVHPPSKTQRQHLQAFGASAKRKREQVRDSTYTNGTKNTNGNALKGCTSPPPFSLLLSVPGNLLHYLLCMA